jgi:hypothetical protein
MVAWYGAKQLKTGGFHYGCTNGAGTFPIGYCATEWLLEQLDTPWEKASESTRYAYMTKANYEAKRAEELKFRHKYHAHGHATEAEALECHLEFQLDQCLKIFTNSNEMLRCKECGEFTQDRAVFNGHFFREIPLCHLHQAREFVRKHMR